MVSIETSRDYTKMLAASGVERTITLNLQYMTGVKKSAATASEPALRNLWTNTILPKLKNIIEQYVVIHEGSADDIQYLAITPVFDVTGPIIRAEIEAEIPRGPVRELMISRGTKITPPWRTLANLDGAAFSKSLIPAIGDIREIISVQLEAEGDRTSAEALARSFLDVLTSSGYSHVPTQNNVSQQQSFNTYNHPTPYRRLRIDEIRGVQFEAQHLVFLGDEVTFEGPIFYGEDDKIQATVCNLTALYERATITTGGSVER